MRPISLAAARVDAGLTQADVAQKLRISKTTLVSWEKGSTEPKTSQMKALCALYNRPVEDLFLPCESN